MGCGVTSRATHHDTGTSLVRRALSGHASIGLLVCALLYIVSLTGSLAVIHERWERWERPDLLAIDTLAPSAAQAAASAAMAASGAKPVTALTIEMPSPSSRHAVVTADGGSWYVDAAGRLGQRQDDGWSEFLIGLHEYLHLPSTWGLILVGVLGIALIAATITGVLAHPRILREAFTLRLRQDAQVARVDWHNRLGVWTLPFVVAVALTGSFLGLAGVGAGAMARLYAGGHVDRVYAPIFGTAPMGDAAPAAGRPAANVAAALRTLNAKMPAARPTYVFVRGVGTRGQDIQIIAALPRRLIYGESYMFDDRGRWRGMAGLSDGQLGQQVAASSYNLHFGNFAGWPMELLYLTLGLGLCVVIGTGTSIWLCKRQTRGLATARLAAGWAVIVWGTPLVLCMTAWAWFAMGAGVSLPLVFWTALAAGLGVAMVRPAWFARPWLRAVALAAVAATAAAHLVVLRPAAGDLVLIDLGLLLVGGGGMWAAGRPRTSLRLRRRFL